MVRRWGRSIEVSNLKAFARLFSLIDYKESRARQEVEQDQGIVEKGIARSSLHSRPRSIV